MIFVIFRFIIGFCVRQFFGRIIIKGSSVESGPVIYASNHPNQAIDPFLVGTLLRRHPYFLAKSTLFKGGILSWFLKSLHMIPVYRRQDSSDTAQNLETFKAACAILEENESVVIFPEGTSSERRVLLPLKTGAARIAFQAEVANNFKLGVQIQPISIVYGNPRIFQSSVTVTFHEPITVSMYADDYAKDPKVAANLLTDALEAKLKDDIPHVHNEQHQYLVENIAYLFGGTDLDDKHLYGRIASAVELSHNTNPSIIDPISDRIDTFLRFCQESSIDVETFRFQRGNIFKTIFQVIISFVGVVVFYLPYQITRLLTERSVKDKHNSASAKIGFGLLSFGAWGLLISAIFGFLTYWPLGFGLFLILVFLGIATNRFVHVLSWLHAKIFACNVYNRLLKERKQLIDELLDLESKART